MLASRSREGAPELSARGQTRGHYGGALYACPPTVFELQQQIIGRVAMREWQARKLSDDLPY
jgi:hypothetical protein